MIAYEAIHQRLREDGWAQLSAATAGFPDEAGTIERLSPTLVNDPRGPGKMHSRDIIGYDRYRAYDDSAPGWVGHNVFEKPSVAHVDGTDDYSRFWLLSTPGGHYTMKAVIGLCRPWLKPRGFITADYFRYSPGVEVHAHRDGFGDIVIIWILNRKCEGANSFLIGVEGHEMVSTPLGTGEVLIFRDSLFQHGVTMLTSGERDALIFITLKDDA